MEELLRTSRTIMLAIGKSNSKIYNNKKKNQLPQHIQIDEAVISIARATFSNGGSLLVPYDEEFAPLITHVAGEYLAPRFAEGGEAIRLPEEKTEKSTKPVNIFHPASDFKAKRKPLKKESWMDLPVELGLLSPESYSLKTLRGLVKPSAIILIGDGKRVRNCLDEALSIWDQLHIFAFHSTGISIPNSSKHIFFFDDYFIKILAEARRKLSWLHLEKDDPKSFHPDSASPEISRFQFIPYALLAQILAIKTLRSNY